MGAYLFQAVERRGGQTDERMDGPTDWHEKANSRFSQFCESAQKLYTHTHTISAKKTNTYTTTMDLPKIRFLF